MKVLTPEEFKEICVKAFGQSWGWQKKLAALCDYSDSHVSKLYHGHKTFTLKNSTYIIQCLEEYDRSKNT